MESIQIYESKRTQMSRPANFNSNNRHRKDNYSLEIKAPYRSGSVYTPFAKKRPLDEKLFLRLKTHTTHNVSMQASDKNMGVKKRRLSLTKTTKMNQSPSIAPKMHQSVGIDSHLLNEKLRRISSLMEAHKLQEALPLIRQLLTRDDNPVLRTKLSCLQAVCYRQLGKLREAEQILSRIIADEPDSYQLYIERGRLRFELSAKELAIRDFNYAIFLQPDEPAAYLELGTLYDELNDIESGLNTMVAALNRGMKQGQIMIKAVQLLLERADKKQQNVTIAQSMLKNCYSLPMEQQLTSSQLMYLQGLLQESKGLFNQACIYYEECLTNNNCRQAVTGALQRLIHIKIEERDYYSAYHTVSRMKILCLHGQFVRVYACFLEGVITVMKKKYELGISILEDILQAIENADKKFIIGVTTITLSPFDHNNRDNNKDNNSKEYHNGFGKGDQKILRKSRDILHPLLLKFLGYASFKLGHHSKTIKYYDKLTTWGLDQCSSYNMLLAEGITLVERDRNFQAGMEKFEQAKYIYPTKVEPSLYFGMTVIYRDLCLNTTTQSRPNGNPHSQSLVSAVVHALEEMNDASDNCNDSSSNLLFHRTILRLYLEDWEQAREDINLCIEKAEENEPKYFYLRGLTYAVTKDIKKAINEYSISLSLNHEYYLSLLERAKCYFLLGETENGFSDLKQYMSKNPKDYTVHKWIGDLLYEGRSYEDAIKAYNEMEGAPSFDLEIMKCKCLIRIGDLHQIQDGLNKASKLEDCNPEKIAVDSMALALLRLLNGIGKNQANPNASNKEILSRVKSMNGALEENRVGYIFTLIDCMNLLGVATLYIRSKEEESHQSFLLVHELFESLKLENESDLKSDCSEDCLSLQLEDIHVNIAIALLAAKKVKQAVKQIQCLAQIVSEKSRADQLQRMACLLEGQEKGDKTGQMLTLESGVRKCEQIRMKPIQLRVQNCRIKCVPTFSVFHVGADDLYSQELAKKMVDDLKPSYIDDMPEGPWIKRNEHGVVFTDHMIEDEGASILLSSMRTNQHGEETDSEQEEQEVKKREVDEKVKKREVEEFKKMMVLDSRVEKKLNSIIDKSHRDIQ